MTGLPRRVTDALAPIEAYLEGLVSRAPAPENLRRALAISDGHAGILFQSPVSITLWVLAAAALSMPFVLRRLKPA